MHPYLVCHSWNLKEHQSQEMGGAEKYESIYCVCVCVCAFVHEHKRHVHARVWREQI